MNFGKTLLELRRKKNVTQEELAAELGVTAAAVSKWENGYTFPDILMLCAIADFFRVTTDELLGRLPTHGLAIVAADTPELGDKIRALAAQYGIVTAGIFDNCQAASAAVRDDEQISHLLIGLLGSDMPELQFDWGSRPISLYLSISDTPQGILNDLRNSLRNNS